jgi:hypothetical protein
MNRSPQPIIMAGRLLSLLLFFVVTAPSLAADDKPINAK